MQFIERLLQIEPDAGSGLFEMAILLAVVGAGMLVARRLERGRTWSRRR